MDFAGANVSHTCGNSCPLHWRSPLRRVTQPTFLHSHSRVANTVSASISETVQRKTRKKRSFELNSKFHIQLARQITEQREKMAEKKKKKYYYYKKKEKTAKEVKKKVARKKKKK
jgi:hypothetical protein